MNPDQLPFDKEEPADPSTELAAQSEDNINELRAIARNNIHGSTPTPEHLEDDPKSPSVRQETVGVDLSRRQQNQLRAWHLREELGQIPPRVAPPKPTKQTDPPPPAPPHPHR